jgi:hypothetical protein
VNYLIRPGQLWRSLYSGRTYRVLGVGDPLGIKVEELAWTFPRARGVYLPAALFAPPAMVPEETAVVDCWGPRR